MRTKNNMTDYLSGEYFISDDQLYKLYEGMLLGEVKNSGIKEQLSEEFESFKARNDYVTSENKLIELSESQKRDLDDLNIEIQFLRDKNLTELEDTELFEMARDSAFNSNYDYAQIVLRHVLRRSPNFHDARLLYGRTFAWNGDYKSAIAQFMDVMKRDPDYLDTYNALTDVYYWQEMHRKSLNFADMGLSLDRNYLPLIYRKARTYYLLGKIDSARTWINEGLRQEPENMNLRDLQEQLSEN